MVEREGVPLVEALRSFLDATVGLPLVGHNVLRFDLRFVEAACHEAGLPAPSRSRYRDTAALYKAHRLGMLPRAGQDHWSFAMTAFERRAPRLRFGLTECCRELGIGHDGAVRHRAAGDVALTQRLYAVLVGAR
jgi:DNA polymerase III epsilon subunit-like protein